MASETGRLRWLEANAANLFLLGGALYAVLVANRILATYTGTSFPQATVFATVAGILIPLGLLGLYPALVERRPYLSPVAAAVAVVPILAWSLVLVGNVLDATGVLTEAPGPLGLTPFVAMITFHLAFALHGVTVLLADVNPKAVGVLMLVTAIVFPLWMTVLSGLPSFVGNGVSLVTFLGIGLLLRNAGLPTDGVDTPAEPTP